MKSIASERAMRAEIGPSVSYAHAIPVAFSLGPIGDFDRGW